MSACLSAGASLTPSPVIATTSPLALQRADEPQLVLGRDAREHRRLARARVSNAVVVERVELAPGERRRRRARSARAIARAVATWSPVIIFTSTPAARHARDRVERGLARRIDHRREAEQLEAAVERRRRRQSPSPRRSATREDAHAARGQRARRPRARPSRGRAAREHDLGRALHVRDALPLASGAASP